MICLLLYFLLQIFLFSFAVKSTFHAQYQDFYSKFLSNQIGSGVHARPTEFFEEELGFGRREKRIVGIRRVLGLGKGIRLRVLDKPHLYSHREREWERKDRLVLLSSCWAVCTVSTKNILLTPVSPWPVHVHLLSLSLSLRTRMPFQIFLDFACPCVLWDEQMEPSTKLKVWRGSNLGKWKPWGNKINK